LCHGPAKATVSAYVVPMALTPRSPACRRRHTA
jgi:hypothetical protein